MATASATISPARTASEISVKTPSRGSRSTFSNSSPGVQRASVGRSASSRPTMAPTSRLPLHSTAVGLVLLAFAPAGLQEEFLTRPMPREPDRVLIPPEVRREEQEVIVAVAAPIFGADDSVAAALGVLLPERVAQPRRIGLAVRTAVQGISRELGARQAIGLG